MDKTSALQFQKGSFDKPMTLPDSALADIKWRCDSVHKAYNHVHTSKPDITVHTEASKTGWVAV